MAVELAVLSSVFERLMLVLAGEAMQQVYCRYSYLGLGLVHFLVLQLPNLGFEHLQINAFLVLGKRPQPPREAGVVEDAAGEVVGGRDHPHGPCDGRVGEALEDAGDVLAGAAGDADALRVRGEAVVAGEPARQGLAERLVARVRPVLQRRHVDGRVGEDALRGRREQRRGEELRRGPAADEVDGGLGGCHGGGVRGGLRCWRW